MSKRMVGGAGAVLATAVFTVVTGCETVQPTPALPTDAFVARRPALGNEAGQGVDRSGPLVYDAQHHPKQPPAGGDGHISETVRQAVKTPADIAAPGNSSDFPPPAPIPAQTSAPTSAPAATQTTSRGVSTGQFLWVGSVLAVVDGEPIYADKVLSTLERPLKAEAQADNEQHFRAVAEDLIGKQIREFIDNDLEYAAAKKALDSKDEQIARFVTGEWRKDQIRKAGGSEALARQHAAEDGSDFDDLVQQQFRLNMTRLYYQNKIIPLIQISAQDIRTYYQNNLRQFQQPAGAKFRVIFVSSDKAGSREAALEKARGLYERARKGEDFAELAGKANDDPGLLRRQGAVGEKDGWMEKGAYASEKVEEAVWQLHPGEVSPPIDAPDHGQDGFWIAKLEEVHTGASQPFESEKVQDAIREILRREQFAKLREMHRRELVEQAVIHENPDVREVTMEMVMQRYKQWTGK